MRASIITLLSCAVFISTSAALHAEHYEVFLVAGQSNCDGRGQASQLKGPLEKWVKPQEDVIIAYSCSKLRGPALTSKGFQPLQPGWSVAPGKNRPRTLPSGTFGPEVSFGRGLADRMKGKNIALIKFTEGGTSLKKDWNPEAKDRLYQAFLDFTHRSLAALKEKGHTFSIRGLIWHQGESDARLSAKEYQQLLTVFITRLRMDLGTPNLVFGIGEVYDNGKRDTIRTAQKATAHDVSGAFLVTIEGLKTSDQGTHFDAASQIELGDRFAEKMVKAVVKRK